MSKKIDTDLKWYPSTLAFIIKGGSRKFRKSVFYNKLSPRINDAWVKYFYIVMDGGFLLHNIICKRGPMVFPIGCMSNRTYHERTVSLNNKGGGTTASASQLTYFSAKRQLYLYRRYRLIYKSIQCMLVDYHAEGQTGRHIEPETFLHRFRHLWQKKQHWWYVIPLKISYGQNTCQPGYNFCKAQDIET